MVDGKRIPFVEHSESVHLDQPGSALVCNRHAITLIRAVPAPASTCQHASLSDALLGGGAGRFFRHSAEVAGES